MTNFSGRVPRAILMVAGVNPWLAAFTRRVVQRRARFVNGILVVELRHPL